MFRLSAQYRGHARSQSIFANLERENLQRCIENNQTCDQIISSITQILSVGKQGQPTDANNQTHDSLKKLVVRQTITREALKVQESYLQALVKYHEKLERKYLYCYWHPWARFTRDPIPEPPNFSNPGNPLADPDPGDVIALPPLNPNPFDDN